MGDELFYLNSLSSFHNRNIDMYMTGKIMSGSRPSEECLKELTQLAIDHSLPMDENIPKLTSSFYVQQFESIVNNSSFIKDKLNDDEKLAAGAIMKRDLIKRIDSSLQEKGRMTLTEYIDKINAIIRKHE